MRVFDQAGLHGRAQRRGVERAREKARVILEADTRPGFSEGAQSTLAERRAGCIGAKRKADVESTKRRWRPGLAARARGPRGTPASRRFPYTRVRPIACASSSSMLRATGSGNRSSSGAVASRAISNHWWFNRNPTTAGQRKDSERS